MYFCSKKTSWGLDMVEPISVSEKSAVKVRFACPPEYKGRFATSHCLLSISVGQPKHEGKKLLATINKVNKNFGKCTIMLADSLQRLNLKVSYPALDWDELWQMARLEGDAWLDRNAEALDRLQIPYEIVRWDSWLNHARFNHSLDLINILYEENPRFRTGVFSTIKGFIERLSKNDHPINCLNVLKYGVEYIKEESAVYLLMASAGYDFILYPSKIIPSFEIIQQYLVAPYFAHKLNWVEIKLE
ncbi:MAG: hypothetical protein K0R66_1324 [Gammaproteobacteria bacterium]|jgi:hypothetical protein|nr:hypothetical protein [Gammaproteobacteria bacterium]